MTFPSQIPVRVDWPVSAWPPKSIAALVDDSRFMELVESWERELHGSRRESDYLSLLNQEAGLSRTSIITDEEVFHFLDAAMTLVVSKDSCVDDVVSRFEILTIAVNLGSLMLKALSGNKQVNLLQIQEMHRDIDSMRIMCAALALKRHMGATI